MFFCEFPDTAAQDFLHRILKTMLGGYHVKTKKATF